MEVTYEAGPMQAQSPCSLYWNVNKLRSGMVFAIANRLSVVCNVHATQPAEHMSGAGSKRKTEREGQIIYERERNGERCEKKLTGVKRGSLWNGIGAVSGLNWPLKFRSMAVVYC